MAAIVEKKKQTTPTIHEIVKEGCLGNLSAFFKPPTKLDQYWMAKWGLARWVHTIFWVTTSYILGFEGPGNLVIETLIYLDNKSEMTFVQLYFWQVNIERASIWDSHSFFIFESIKINKKCIVMYRHYCINLRWF